MAEDDIAYEYTVYQNGTKQGQEFKLYFSQEVDPRNTDCLNDDQSKFYQLLMKNNQRYSTVYPNREYIHQSDKCLNTRRVEVTISLEKDLPVMRFEVTIDSLPVVKKSRGSYSNNSFMCDSWESISNISTTNSSENQHKTNTKSWKSQNQRGSSSSHSSSKQTHGSSYICSDNSTNKGYEVVVRFRSLNITNDGMFYTDSNGLEMQKRKLDHQESYDMKEDKLTSHVAENYYPVTSAIAIKDQASEIQLTVMTDRSQGGSSLKNGTIELMQNRLTSASDNRGMEESIIELREVFESHNYGINKGLVQQVIVSNTYRVEIFKASQNRKSSQRLIQQKTSSPPQIFVNFENEGVPNLSKTVQIFKNEPKLDYFGIKSEINMVLQKQNDNFLLRFDNLADSFDGVQPTQFVRLSELVSYLWISQNDYLYHQNIPFATHFDISNLDIQIQEVTLSGYKSDHEKFQWKTNFKNKGSNKKNEDDENFRKISMRPQQSRSFKIKFGSKVDKNSNKAYDRVFEQIETCSQQFLDLKLEKCYFDENIRFIQLVKNQRDLIREKNFQTHQRREFIDSEDKNQN